MYSIAVKCVLVVTIACVQYIVSGLMQLLQTRTELTRCLNISQWFEIFTSILHLSALYLESLKTEDGVQSEAVMRLGTGGGVASVRISDKQDAEFLCKFCDNRKFKSSAQFMNHLSSSHVSVEGGSYICR